ncbi:hypothetical protein LJC58_01285 [Lachnospiraceae bacterium OttesenSCG-928-D06]|nr:hypothetical protein [Lachnospiraceae bacterium OttesenSCG-928-D06]
MSVKYPEILKADVEGNLLYHSMGCHYNLNHQYT